MGTMRTAMTAFSTLTNLSRAGHDFQHHFGTSMALQPQIVGATGNGAVMSLGAENAMAGGRVAVVDFFFGKTL